MIESLEKQLDSYDPAQRRQALQALCGLVADGTISPPKTGDHVNLHTHTFFSYNAYGFSPSKYAWLARNAGLAAAGVVDFDVLDALEEFIEAGRMVGLKTCVSVESRAFVPEYETRVINSPGEPGVSYHMGVGFTRFVQHPYLAEMRAGAERRSIEMLARVNTFMKPVELDYQKDVVPLTPKGNVTERHLCAAFERKAREVFPDDAARAAFWTEKLGDAPSEGAKLQNLIRAKTMKKGGVGYAQPGKGSFPLMADMNRFILECGAIPTIAWLDGTTEGEQNMEDLFKVAMATGAAALNIIPDRNYTPGVKDQKVKNLYDVVALAEKYDFPVIVGTEMNAPGNKFVDAFDTAELAPLVPVFLKGAHIVYAHSVLQRQSGLGYLSDWAKKTFPTVAAKNEFFQTLGRELQPAFEDRLSGLSADATPEQILSKIKNETVMTTSSIPAKQRAVQLVGPDQLLINESKEVFEPGDHQVLGKVEVVGLCFSDLKLLKQFSGHARKSTVTAGIDPAALLQMPNFVPGDKPTVPGHETVVRIVKVGGQVTRHKVGERYLVQTDYRWLPTANSNSAFGYNFEGALQEYVLMDERIITAPDGESMLIPVPEDLSASAIALVEPWACVEDSYVEKQRQTLKEGGQMLVVGETPVAKSCVKGLPGAPKTIKFTTADKIAKLKNAAYDDIVYFGSNAATVEQLFPKVAVSGILNIVQCGGKFGRPVQSMVGRVHYGGIRVIGTTSNNPADSLTNIPPSAEVRPNNKVNVIGAAGPMGTMHVIRVLCQGVPGVTVFAGDLSDDRLNALQRVAEPLAAKNGLTLRPYNPSKEKLTEQFDYIVLMAPVPALVVASIPSAAQGAIINIFAGIPANVSAALDLDTYIEKRIYFIGTSGSVLEDMKQVLAKVVSRRLDTNLSVAAISGIDGAIDGIRAVEKNTMPGKILVYPSCHGLKVTPLTELGSNIPLDNGLWTKQSEDALLNQYK